MGNNSYQGTTTIGGSGTLEVSDGCYNYGFEFGTSGTLGLGNVVIGTNASLTFARDGSGSGVMVANDISGGGTLTQAGYGALVLTGTLQAGSVSILGGATLAFDSSNAISVSSLISGAGSLAQQGAGTLTLAGSSNNTYSGGTTIAVGSTLRVGSGTPNVLGTGAVTVNGDGTGSPASNGSLDLDGFNPTIGGLGGGGIVTSGATRTTSTLTVSIATANSAFSGTIEDGPTAAAAYVGLATAGSYTLTLTGNNSYSGATTIGANGTLQVGNGYDYYGFKGAPAGRLAPGM